VSYLCFMGAAARKAVDDLMKIANGQSESLLRLEKTRPIFHARLEKTLSNLPKGEIIEIPSAPAHLPADEDAAPSKERSTGRRKSKRFAAKKSRTGSSARFKQ
jgi:hypothetical protein